MMLCTTLSKLQSDPSLSVFILIAWRTDFYRLGPQGIVSIEFFNYIFALFESPWKSVRPIPVLLRGWWAVFSRKTIKLLFNKVSHVNFEVP